jgi:triacylglycerol lipase
MRRLLTRIVPILAVALVVIAARAAVQPGAKPLRCATSRHPEPVVLVPGTFDATNWTAIGDTLAADGYCVSTFDYGDAGAGSMDLAAQRLDRFVRRELTYTHAARVDIVGHSQGGLVARYYARFLGGASKIDDLVALAPPNHGTTTPLVISGSAIGCIACLQQTAGSDFLARLNAGDGTPPPVDYTVIETRYDLVVTPYWSALLRGPADRITNVVMQDRCPGDLAGHLNITLDRVAAQWVEDALGHSGPADPAFTPRC